MPRDTNYPTRRRVQSKDKAKSSGATLGFEEKLWQAADKLRGHMDPANYKHVVFGLVFLKYISDAFAERHTWLLREAADPKSDYYVKQERGRYEVAEVGSVIVSTITLKLTQSCARRSRREQLRSFLA
jgi:type I restriction-modification system DNA methylase subunit